MKIDAHNYEFTKCSDYNKSWYCSFYLEVTEDKRKFFCSFRIF